jgi:hypothetical protein
MAEIQEGLGDDRKYLAPRMHDIPLAQNRELGDVEQRDRAAGALGAQRVERQHGDPESANHGLLDGFVAAQFHANAGLDALALEQLQRGFANPRTGLAHQEIFPGETPQRNVALTGKRVVMTGHDHQRIGCEGIDFDVGQLLRDMADDVQVVFVARQACQHPVVVVDFEREFDIGVLACELAEDAGRQVLGGGDRGKAQPAALESAEIRQLDFEVGQGAQNFPAGVVELTADLGGEGFSPHLFEQGQSHRIGELLDLNRDGGLRQVELFCRVGETAQTDDRLEHLQLAERGVPDQVSRQLGLEHDLGQTRVFRTHDRRPGACSGAAKRGTR